MLQCTIAGGRTKRANERPFVFIHQHGSDDVVLSRKKGRGNKRAEAKHGA